MTTGRPRKYNDPKLFESRVDAYFDEIQVTGKPPTLAGLCLSLGFCDREALSEYAKYGEAFSRTVKKAKLRIEQDRAERVASKDTFTPGVIFDLKVNHGWQDKEQVNLNHSGETTVKVVTGVDRD